MQSGIDIPGGSFFIYQENTSTAMAKKAKPQQYFFLLGDVPSKLNNLESELLFWLQREDRTVFDKQQELSRWLEGLGIQCATLNSIHKRSSPAAVMLISDKANDVLKYKLTERISIIIYKSKI